MAQLNVRALQTLGFAVFCIAAARPATGQPNNPVARTSQEVLIAQSMLAEFGYGVRFTGRMDEQTIRVIREYQTRSGLNVTGELDHITLVHMFEDADDIQLPKPGLMIPYMLMVTPADSFAAGIWLPNNAGPDIVNKSDSFPESSKIFCGHESKPGFPMGFCEDFTVVIDPVGPYGPTLGSGPEYVQTRITHWDQSFIEAEGLHRFRTSAISRRPHNTKPGDEITYIYRFDLETRTVTKTLIRRDAAPGIQTVEHYTLSDPVETTWKWQRDKALKARRRVLIMDPEVSH